jgi:hypothetical protein
VRHAKPVALVAALLLIAACDAGPVAPEGPSHSGLILHPPLSGSIDVRCPSTIALGSSNGRCEAWTGTGWDATLIADPDWSSNAPGVVSINPWGWLTAHAYGTATITAQWAGRTGHAYVNVYDPAPSFSVTINGPNRVGPNEQCTYTAQLSGASSANYTWTADGATGTASGATWVGGTSGQWFTLTVTATSGGQSATHTHGVFVSPDHSGCGLVLIGN